MWKLAKEIWAMGKKLDQPSKSLQYDLMLGSSAVGLNHMRWKTQS
jgi:hypothetical protein